MTEDMPENRFILFDSYGVCHCGFSTNEIENSWLDDKCHRHEFEPLIDYEIVKEYNISKDGKNTAGVWL